MAGPANNAAAAAHVKAKFLILFPPARVTECERETP
jgi:hypothetical protein